MNSKTLDRGPLRLPIKLDNVSNGEYVPPPQDPRLALVRRAAFERAADDARRLGWTRRHFLQSSCGAATVLLTLNELMGCRGGRYAVASEARYEREAADEALRGDELVFDVQTHHVSLVRPWTKQNVGMTTFLSASKGADCGRPDWLECYGSDPYIKDIFLDSDTDLTVLSALPGSREMNPLLTEEMAETRTRLAKLAGSPRLRIHGILLPNDGSPDSVRDRMQAQVETWKVAAWKLYPLWGADGSGFFLDDPESSLPYLEHGIRLGVPLFAVHKGLPLAGYQPDFTHPRDVGPTARRFPNAVFLIYHSGYDPNHVEGAYDPAADKGIDALIRNLEEHGIGKGGNVYAELGSTWWHVMRNPDEAAHVLGKLLVHLGEDRILWGTDCIWYGSPQDQLMAFRSFQIAPEFRERFGYPELTPTIKSKILGLNAARVYGLDPSEVKKRVRSDDLAVGKSGYLENPSPSFRTYGPRTRREVFELFRFERAGG